jgi:hypothetical protein
VCSIAFLTPSILALASAGTDIDSIAAKQAAAKANMSFLMPNSIRCGSCPRDQISNGLKRVQPVAITKHL